MMEWLRNRDRAAVAIVVTIVLAAAVLVSINLDRLPFLQSDTTYRAQFANAAGLSPGDDVRVAGVTEGSVDSIKVQQAHVVVTFHIDDGIALGSRTGASIELATVLGALFLQLHTAGPGHLASGATIPLTRTTVPFTLIDTLDTAGAEAGRTDTTTLRRSLQQLASTLSGVSPSDATAALKGLSSVATALGSRQAQITRLIADTDTIFRTLSSKRDSLVRLMGNADTFVRMLISRRDAINSLLTTTSSLSAQVSTLITRNGARLGGVLADVDAVSAVLRRRSAQLTSAVSTLGQFSVNIANATGSGPWLDLLLPTGIIPDSLIAACGTKPTPGCGR